MKICWVNKNRILVTFGVLTTRKREGVKEREREKRKRGGREVGTGGRVVTDHFSNFNLQTNRWTIIHTGVPYLKYIIGVKFYATKGWNKNKLVKEV